MKKFNYRVTVNINGSVLSLGFRGRVPEEMEGKSFRLQAIFSQRMTQRRFPMNVIVEEGEEGWEIRGDADVELPYVFYAPPKYQVNITFALWCGMQEIILDDQPFPVEKDLFSRTISGAGKRNLPLFALCTLAVPFITLKYYLSEDHNVNKALRKANAVVHDLTGYSYSSRQKNTDYFASMYNRYVARNKEVQDILFLSERLPEEDGNLRIIEREFQKEQIYPITEFINTKRIDQLSKSEIRECAVKAARAKVIILEDFYPQLHAVRIRPETKVVQLWHACGAFKTFGLSRIGKPGGAPQSSMNHRNYDLVPVSSETIRGIYSEAFAISMAKVQSLGVPRTDLLFSWEYKRKMREELYEKYPVLQESKVILYAPTFRGDGNKDAYFPFDKFKADEFMDKMPEDTVLVVKNHPFVRQHIEIPDEWKDRVLDLSDEHINQLMLVSNLLITDFSSCIFEAAILDLPILFYAFDKEEYIRERDFYFDYDQLTPGPVCQEFDQLTQTAYKMVTGEEYLTEEDDIGKKAQEFREAFIGSIDGHSSQRVVDYIKKRYLK